MPPIVIFWDHSRMLIPILLLIAVILYCFGINRLLGLPPGPPPLPILGNMLSFNWEVDKLLLSWKAKYGRIFTVWLPFPMVVIGEHKVLQEHIVKNGDIYVSKKNPEQLMDIMSGGLYGLAFEDNSIEQRKFAMRALHDIGFGSAALEDTVHHYAQEIVGRWRKSGDSPVDVTENIMFAVGNLLWRVTFGFTLEFNNPIINKFRDLQRVALKLMGGPFMMFLEMFPFLRKFDSISPVRKIRVIVDEANVTLNETIASVEKSFNADNQPNCYVEAFLAEVKKREEAGVGKGSFHYDQLLSSVTFLWGAGFDTTVSVLRFCILQLVNHDYAQRKIQKEIDEVIGERRIFHDDQKLLPYTSAFLQEISRLFNVIPVNFIRETTQDTEIEGFPIRAGTGILPQFSMVHSDPNEFEQPDYFCPERHINEEGQFIKDPRITPFSLGKRSCLGEPLARMEIFVMVTTFVQNCHFSPVNKIPPAIKFLNGFTRTTAHFLVKIQPRH